MAGEIKKFRDINNTDHKVDITGVEGLSSALGGKANTSHSHSGIVGEYQTEYVRLNNNHVEMQGDLVEIYASDQQGGNINLKVGTEDGESITASIHERNIGKLNNVLAGTISQSDVTGLSTALANKLSSSVHYELLNTSSAKKNLSSMTIGDLYLFKNQYSKQLSQIINNDVIGANLYFHQGAGSIATDYIMVRIYKWVLPDDTDERLCEIVGAWDA